MVHDGQHGRDDAAGGWHGLTPMPKPPPTAATAHIPRQNSPKVAAASLLVHGAIAKAKLELLRHLFRMIGTSREMVDLGGPSPLDYAVDRHLLKALGEINSAIELHLTEQTKGK